MGTIIPFIKENLIMGILSSDRENEEDLIRILEKDFGETDYTSGEIEFSYTRYYDEEMGPGIRRRFLSFREPVSPELLPEIKIRTNDIEQKYAVDGRRKINLDPGLLDLNRLILATTKNTGHRIPLSRGIYGEVTLIYMNKGFQPLPWTYSDFQSPEYAVILKEIRELFRKKIPKS